ncbi:MAG: TRAP transporter small permease [Aurantimonas coralicida]|jgi:TRAP-type C4-dicarboxylate transport system permease small subunit|uniref:TRAP transporter small permease protein n=1 Tax=Aurantimonas coralicida TaxID=182270 RepID=A0A0N7KXD5_9HYPH|nr:MULTISPECIES: TRAP transporter small permease [Aurantimonas]MBC6717462.1 TRAP transporter small permease [Aurantimonas sp. DM33-3]BAT26617.1 TRAP-type C4-dicarboxylate transport system, small permease component [Aurantimonas coralicida]
MRHFLLTIEPFVRRLARTALWGAGIGLVTMTLIIFWQVFARYVLNDSPSWTESTSVQLMGWFIFLGASVGIHEGYHLGFDVLVYVVPDNGKKALRTISDLAVLGFSLAMMVYGTELMAGTWNTTIPTLGLPGGTTFMPLIVGAVLSILFTANRILRRFSGLENANAFAISD